MSASFILAQLSDTHIMVEPRRDVTGAVFDHGMQLSRAFAATTEYRPDAIVITGDLVNDARADEYKLFADLIRNPPAPLYLLPGNHDDVGLMREMLPQHRYLPRSGPLSFVIDDFPVRLVSIDQTVHGETWGKFTPEHALWLDDVLKAAPNKPTMVALHHPPFPTHDRLFDTIGLHDHERFEGVIAKHRQVVRIICGHHHRGIMGMVAHAPCVVAPSTAWAYGDALRPEQPVARVTGERPGWVLHAWSADNGLASHFMGF